jgi:hypothetical protein
MNTFGATTRYDWYVLKNCPPTHTTTIREQDGKFTTRCLSKLSFIPNGMFDEIMSLVAKDGEEKVEVLYDRTAYGSDKKNMSKEQKGEFKYPCIQSVSVKSDPCCVYFSSTKDNGHFGIPKVIFTKLGEGVMIDFDGKYATCQDCSSIVDSKENLSNIYKAMKSSAFVTLMKHCNVGGQAGNVYDRKVIALFRKDFWKSFVDEGGNEIK